MGRTISEVFRIVDEETRDELKSPVEQALEKGVMVGLADRTALVSRDGTDRPIDDCAAPIVDDRGDILGAVLVFRAVSRRRSMEKAL